MPIKTFAALEYMNATNYNTYCQNNGLRWISTNNTNFGTSSLTSDVFTTEFDAYRVIVSAWRPTNNGTALLMRLRTSAGQYSAANYYWSYNGVVWATSGAIGNNASPSTNFQITQGATNRNHGITIEVTNVRTSGKPHISWQAVDTTNLCNRVGGGFVNNTADYTGFDLFTSDGFPMLCDVSVYGYRKA
jgi:hypothetical protein